MQERGCCAPSRGDVGDKIAPVSFGDNAPSDLIETVPVPGGPVQVGTDNPVLPNDGEGPSRKLKIKSFRIMAEAVTNALFEQFVAATGYVTEAEQFGWSFVFHSQVPEQIITSQAVARAQWWRRIDGACWRAINGPGTEDAVCPDHPVVHVSWNDAKAFAKWAGGRLPTEAEWEHAARGGLGDVPFPWGDVRPNDTDHFPCNIWQGRFPDHNTAEDGYHATAPARSYAANGYGLYNMCGNTWEWTAEPFKIRSLSKAARQNARQMAGMKLIKGGSFLCHDSYCFRYRIAARTGNTPDSSTTHQGMRLVFDADEVKAS